MEIRSVNSRFLDLTFKLPDDLRGTEPALRDLLVGRLKRGKVEVRAWVEGKSDQGATRAQRGRYPETGGLQDNVRAWLPSAARPHRGRSVAAHQPSSEPARANGTTP